MSKLHCSTRPTVTDSLVLSLGSGNTHLGSANTGQAAAGGSGAKADAFRTATAPKLVHVRFSFDRSLMRRMHAALQVRPSQEVVLKDHPQIQS